MISLCDRLDSAFFVESCNAVFLFIFIFLLSRVSGREKTNFTVHETNINVYVLF